MPSPKKNESQKQYIARCMSSEESKKSFSDVKQRAAFCFSKWKSRGNVKNNYIEAIQEHVEKKAKDKK